MHCDQWNSNEAEILQNIWRICATTKNMRSPNIFEIVQTRAQFEPRNTARTEAVDAQKGRSFCEFYVKFSLIVSKLKCELNSMRACGLRCSTNIEKLSENHQCSMFSGNVIDNFERIC